MAPIRTLSEDTIQLLNEMAQWYKNSGNRKRINYIPETDHQASQCYVAYAPDGIPALSNNIPGNAYCTIWEITDDVSGTTSPVLLQIGNSENTERVFNLSGTAIEANSWIPIIRDKFGRWLVAGGAGGTTSGGGSVSGTGLDVYSYVIPYSDFSSAGNTSDILVANLPASSKLISGASNLNNTFNYRVPTAFRGGSVSNVTIEPYTRDTSGFTFIVGPSFSAYNAVNNWNNRHVTPSGGDTNFGEQTQLRILLTTASDVVNSLTQGELWISVVVWSLPETIT